MAARRYRFSWDHEHSKFQAPGVFAELNEQDPAKNLISRIVDHVNKNSGAKQLSGWVLVIAHYLLLIVLLVIYCFVEAGVKSNMTGFLLFAVPFLSFVPIVYAMVRDRPLVKITKFMEKNERAFNQELSQEKYNLTSLFISGHTLKGTPFSFFQGAFLGFDFSGFLEFEDRRYLTDPDAPRLTGTRSLLIEQRPNTNNWELQSNNAAHRAAPPHHPTNSGSGKHSLVHPSNNQQYVMDHPFNDDWNSRQRPSSAASNHNQANPNPLWDPSPPPQQPQRPFSPSGPRPEMLGVSSLGNKQASSERPIRESSTGRDRDEHIQKQVVLWDPANPSGN